jgi:hypothetical protein
MNRTSTKCRTHCPDRAIFGNAATNFGGNAGTMHRARSSAHVGARQRSTTSISAHKRESIERPLVPFPRLDLCPTATSEKSRQRIRLRAGCQKPNYGRPRSDTGKIAGLLGGPD